MFLFIFLGPDEMHILYLILNLNLRSCSWKRQSWVFKPRPLRKDLHSRWEETFLITWNRDYYGHGHVHGGGGGDVIVQ